MVSLDFELEPRGQLVAAAGGHSSGSLTADDGPTDIVPGKVSGACHRWILPLHCVPLSVAEG
jgi:hypothetical protein